MEEMKSGIILILGNIKMDSTKKIREKIGRLGILGYECSKWKRVDINKCPYCQWGSWARTNGSRPNEKIFKCKRTLTKSYLHWLWPWGWLSESQRSPWIYGTSWDALLWVATQNPIHCICVPGTSLSMYISMEQRRWRTAQACQLKQSGVSNPSDDDVIRHITKKELANHCCRKTCGVEEMTQLICHLLEAFPGDQGSDTLGVSLLDADRIWDICESQNTSNVYKILKVLN